MNGHPPPMAPPGSVWKTTTSPDGKEYYFNTITQQTTWTKPDELKDDVDRAILGTGWEVHTANGKRYFAHAETKQSSWTVPDDVQKIIDRNKQNQPPQRPPPAGPVGWAAGPSPYPPSYDNRRPERDEYRPDRHERDRDRDRDRDREAGFGGDRPNISFTTGAELQFSSPQEAEAVFAKVLRQMKVQPDWDWQQAVRVGVKDTNWRAIPEPEKREEAFKKYCEELRAQEKHKEQDRQAKLRADFTDMLGSHPEIQHYTRWRTALPIIEEESIFRSAKDDGERRSLFEEYIVTLKKAHEEKQAENRRSALDEVMGLLQDLDLEPFTRWQTAEEKLEHNNEFNSDKFQSLPRMDVLTQFEKHIRQLQREHNDRVQADRRVKHRLERGNRDAFRTLLNELRENGKLHAGTKWKDIHDTIQPDPRYVSMLGQGGSSPVDLFWDALEEEEGKFRTLRRHALDVLEHQRFEVTTSTPLEEFLLVMGTDPRTANIDEQSMHSIYNYVITKVKKREESERRDEEQNERYAMDALRSVIKRLDPPVLLSDTWEVVRPRVEKADEFRALKSDTLRESVFDKYIRRLKEKDSDRRDRSRRDERERDRDSRRDRDREYRNGHSDSHRRQRTRTRSPEHDPYAAERRRAQQDREARYRNNDSTDLSPARRERREDDRFERSRRSSGDHYARDRREREAERERSYVSRADPREAGSGLLDYGDSGGRTSSTRRRRESDESTSRRDRDAKRVRYSPNADPKSKTPVPEPTKKEEEDHALRSGSEEGEIEED